MPIAKRCPWLLLIGVVLGIRVAPGPGGVVELGVRARVLGLGVEVDGVIGHVDRGAPGGHSPLLGVLPRLSIVGQFLGHPILTFLSASSPSYSDTPC